MKTVKNISFGILKENYCKLGYNKSKQLLSGVIEETDISLIPNKKYSIIIEFSTYSKGYYKRNIEIIENIKFEKETNNFYCFENKLKISKNNLVCVKYK